jgi:hypothetical protein
MAPAPGSCRVNFQLFVGESVGAYIRPCFRRSPKLADKFNKYVSRKLDNWIRGDLAQKGTFLRIKTPKNRRT